MRGTFTQPVISARRRNLDDQRTEMTKLSATRIRGTLVLFDSMATGDQYQQSPTEERKNKITKTSVTPNPTRA
jgi:hypothetical protein